MAANKVKAEFEQLLTEKAAEVKIKAKEAKFKAEKIDVTEPGKEITYGVKHPITQIIDEVVEILSPWVMQFMKDQMWTRSTTLLTH